jgi:hypothetical protein
LDVRRKSSCEHPTPSLSLLPEFSLLQVVVVLRHCRIRCVRQVARQSSSGIARRSGPSTRRRRRRIGLLATPTFQRPLQRFGLRSSRQPITTGCRWWTFRRQEASLIAVCWLFSRTRRPISCLGNRVGKLPGLKTAFLSIVNRTANKTLDRMTRSAISRGCQVDRQRRAPRHRSALRSLHESRDHKDAAVPDHLGVSV